MPNYEDPIVVKIISEAGQVLGPGSASSAAKGGSSGGGGGGGAASFAKLGGMLGSLVAIAGEVAAIIKDGLANIIGPIRQLLVSGVKLIAQLLRPIVDVVIILIKPILDFLSPIIRVMMQAYQPFRQAAMATMQEASKALRSGNTVKYTGLMAASLGFALGGINAMVMKFIGEGVKLMIMAIGELLKPLLPNSWVDKTVKFISDGIDTTTNAISGTIYDGLEALATSFEPTLKNTLATIQEGSKKQITAAASALDKNFIDAASDTKYQTQAFNAGKNLADSFINGLNSKSSGSKTTILRDSSGKVVGAESGKLQQSFAVKSDVLSWKDPKVMKAQLGIGVCE